MALLLRRSGFNARLSFGYLIRSANRSVSSETKSRANEVEDDQLKPTKDSQHNKPPFENKLFAPPEYRFIYPEFLPDKDPSMRHHVREILERKDMLHRRRIIDIPEFYVGSIMAVTAADKFAPGKTNRFVGICIHRSGYGLRAIFILRNVVDHQGVEIMYEMYNPTLIKITVLKLEKRLDDELFYLRDALPEYSTFPFDMEPVLHYEGSPIPINPIKVKLRPQPWNGRWERKELKGIEPLDLPDQFFEDAAKVSTPWEKYDLMKEYRRLIPEEEQQEIYAEVHAQQKDLQQTHKKVKRKILRRPTN